ncbi:MAG: ABC transporter permease [Cyclobacteriaceae bacterium]
MIRNLLLTAFRSLTKSKFFSALNILGLAIGMAVFLLIAQYVKFETSYEDFIDGNENIYRVKLETFLNNELLISSAENYPGAGLALADELPEVTGYARLYNLGYKNNVIITNEDAQPEPIAFKHRRFLYADSSFLPMMGSEMLLGNAETALSEPNTCVISEKYTTMYFGNEDPLGKSLRMQDDDHNNELVKITGVFKDLPPNTHLKYDVLFSYKTLFGRGEWATDRYNLSWQRKDMYTFIKVTSGTDIKALESKFPAIVSKFKPDQAARNQRDVLSLQALPEIHLTSRLAEEPEPNGDQRIVKFLSIIGIFVLIIAWINYINLSTAKAMERAREVGVRKVMGAFKGQLVLQFLAESALVNFFSLLISMGLIALALPYFNSISGLSLTINYLVQPWFLVICSALWVLGTLLSGFYPAVVLSSFKPVTILKGKLKNSISGILLRKTLVVIQFTASVALIAGTFIVYQQLNFMMGRDIGMNIDQVMVVERPGITPLDRSTFNSAIDVFRNEVKKDPSISALSASVTIPGKQREYKAGAKRYGAPDDQAVTVRFNSMDFEFMDVFKMKLLAGRTFSEDYISDPDTAVVVTESASRLLGFEKPEDAIGQTITIAAFGFSPIIVGVVNDYHQVSLKSALDPIVFYCTKYGGEYYSLRLNANDLGQSIENVKVAWSKAFPGNPFSYFFLDDFFNKQYENEKQFGRLFTTFATFAVIVGCLGLFGLSAYTATQRTKEIGIRKVLGSSESKIFLLLSSEYIRLIMLAIIIAMPLIYFGMNSWISSFPYQTEISLWIFLVSGCMVLIVSLITVTFQTIRAARTNPVNALRHE